MIMRKYLVTIHEDGSVSTVEYEDPEDQALRNFQAGAKSALHTVIDILSTRKDKFFDISVSCKRCGDIVGWKRAISEVCSTSECISCIKASYHMS